MSTTSQRRPPRRDRDGISGAHTPHAAADPTGRHVHEWATLHNEQPTPCTRTHAQCGRQHPSLAVWSGPAPSTRTQHTGMLSDGSGPGVASVIEHTHTNTHTHTHTRTHPRARARTDGRTDGRTRTHIALGMRWAVARRWRADGAPEARVHLGSARHAMSKSGPLPSRAPKRSGHPNKGWRHPNKGWPQSPTQSTLVQGGKEGKRRRQGVERRLAEARSGTG